jgi:hypothetical protein
VALVLDSGAFIAYERGDQRAEEPLRWAQRNRIPLRTSAAVLAQVWRSGARQARLARALQGVRIDQLDEEVGRRIGQLLAQTGMSDVIDGHLALIARDRDTILTSDVADIGRAVAAAGVRARVVQV